MTQSNDVHSDKSKVASTEAIGKNKPAEKAKKGANADSKDVPAAQQAQGTKTDEQKRKEMGSGRLPAGNSQQHGKRD